MPPLRPDDAREPGDRSPRWPPAHQCAGIVAWTSFLGAAATSILCFALIDPAAFAPLQHIDAGSARMLGYAIGFFLLWLASASASLLTLYLLRTVHVPGAAGDR